MKPNIKIVNSTTGEEIIREMNEDEFEIHLQKQENHEKVLAELSAKAAAKAAAQAKLEALGLTVEDLQALGL